LSEKNITQKIKSIFICLIAIYLSLIFSSLLFIQRIVLKSKAIGEIYQSLNTLLYATFASLFVSVFGIIIFLSLRDLIYAKRKRSTQRNFIIMICLMTLQVLYLNVHYSSGNREIDLSSGGAGGVVILMSLIAAMVTNSFRNSWIHYLNKRQKVTCFGWGVLLLPAAYMLIIPSYSQIVMQYSISLGIFLRQVALFLAIYGSMAILSILFHLPTAGLYDRRTKEIDSLHKLSKAIALEFDPDKLAVMITRQSSEVIEAAAVWLELWDNELNTFLLVSSNNLDEVEQEKIRSLTPKKINSWIQTNRNAIIINEIARDERAHEFINANLNIGSLLGVPLISYDKFLGILYAVKIEEFGFGFDDRNMLQAFADQVAVALENARLVKESIIKERLEQELKIAHDAQMKLLPKKMPKINSLDIAAICVTANEVGGDYYDFFKINENRLAIVIGDVSGKGPEAAFYMAEVKGIIEAMSKIYSSPREILIKTNETLYENWERKTFITMIYCIIDTKEMAATSSRAGHCPLIFCRGENHGVEFIESTGIGLGMERGIKFKRFIEEKSFCVKPDDVLIFYTDGVLEARNNLGEEFGERQLLESIPPLAHLSASQIQTELVRTVQKFVGTEKSHDDSTIIVVKFV